MIDTTENVKWGNGMTTMTGEEAERAILAGTAPNGLTVEGSLFLHDCTRLTALPDGLTVEGSLDLNGCTSLTKLPEGLTVKGSLDLGGCTGLTALPEGLTVRWLLYLHGCTGLRGTPRTSGQQKALVSVAKAALKRGALYMGRWHTCSTTHCIAGWAQHLSDDPKMKTLHPSFAGYLLLGADAATWFYLSDEQARDYLRSVLEDEGVTA